MRYFQLQTTYIPSNRTLHKRMIAILGSLVVLSLFMLVFGATSTMAHTGQDERCSEFKGKARGLCKKAVRKGCFDGVESQECDELTIIWNERCRQCEGIEAPWEVECPCAFLSAVELNEAFQGLEFGQGPVTRVCIDEEDETRVWRTDGPGGGGTNPTLLVATGSGGGGCYYTVNSDEDQYYERYYDDLTEGELDACREDIRKLIAELDDCPTP